MVKELTMIAFPKDGKSHYAQTFLPTPQAKFRQSFGRPPMPSRGSPQHEPPA